MSHGQQTTNLSSIFQTKVMGKMRKKVYSETNLKYKNISQTIVGKASFGTCVALPIFKRGNPNIMRPCCIEAVVSIHTNKNSTVARKF